MKIRKILIITVIMLVTLMLYIESSVLFRQDSNNYTAPKTAIGLVVTDCEDDWKEQMYDSILQSAKKENIQVTTIQTSRTQSDQIEAIRTLLVYRTDAIIFSPVMKNGWEYIIMEAANAHIPLITINEQLSQSDSLETAQEEYPIYHVGFDYYSLAGKLASSVIHSEGEIHFVQLDGTVASSIAHDIASGFRDTLEKSEIQQQIFSVNGDYMRSRSYDLINAMIRNEYQLDAILSCNDAMTLGAITALEENGLQPGEDVIIYSLGGGTDVSKAFELHKVTVLGKCELTAFGDTVIETVSRLKDGDTPPQTHLLDGTLLINRSTNP